MNNTSINNNEIENTELELIKYPYLGFSSNLIDYFLIIGYEDSYIDKSIKVNIKNKLKTKLNLETLKSENNMIDNFNNISYYTNNTYDNKIIDNNNKTNDNNNKTNDSNDKNNNSNDKNKNKNNFLSTFLDKNKPSILSNISNLNYNEQMIEEEKIIEIIYPNVPNIYYFFDESLPQDSNYNLIFNYNDLKQNKIFNGFAYKFYEIFIFKNIKLALPKSIVIISQYPFFSFYNHIIKDILKLFKNKILEIPIEILIYNIINYLPAPIDYSYKIKLFPENTLKTYETKINENEDIFKNEKIISKNNSSYIENKKKLFEKKCISQLSGYPIIDFNIDEIFKYFQFEFIIELFIYSFLQQDLIIFYDNLEELNILLFSLYQLNYPLNYSSYFENIFALSKEEVMYENKLKIIDKKNSKLIGIFNEYDKSIVEHLKTTFYKDVDYFFTCDLSEQKIKFECNENIINKNEFEKIKELFVFINKVIQKETGENNKLKEILLRFKFRLNEIIIKITNQLTNNILNLQQEINNQSFLKSSTNFSIKNEVNIIINNVPEFFISDINNLFSICKIQEYFLNFVMEIYTLIYNNYKIIKSENEEKKKDFFYFLNDAPSIIQKNSNNFYIKILKHLKFNNSIDNFFLEILIKNNILFFSNFIKNYELKSNLNKIPLIFFEEFLLLNSCKEKINYFNVIDNFYKNKIKILELNFNNFYSFYNKNNYYNFFIDLSKDNKNFKIQTKSKKHYFQYYSVKLDKNILFEYINKIENLSNEEKIKYFPMIKILQKEKEKINLRKILNSIERILIEDKKINFIQIFVFIVLLLSNLFILKIKNNFFNILFNFFNSNIFILKKYISIFLLVFYRILLKNIQQKKPIQNLIEIFNELINLILIKNILPNEIILNLINKISNLIKNLSKEENIINNNNENNKNLNELNLLKLKIFLKKNFCKCEIKNENVFYHLIRQNFIFNGDVNEECDKCNIIIKPEIFIKSSFLKKQKKSLIFSIIKSLNEANKFIKIYFYDLDNKKIEENKNEINNLIINCIFYLYLLKKFDKKMNENYYNEILNFLLSIII